MNYKKILKELWYLDNKEHPYIYQMAQFMFASMFILFVKVSMLVVVDNTYAPPTAMILFGMSILMLYQLYQIFVFKLQGFFAFSFLILTAGVMTLTSWIVTFSTFYLTMCLFVNVILMFLWRNK